MSGHAAASAAGAGPVMPQSGPAAGPGPAPARQAALRRWPQPKPHTLLVIMAITLVAVAFGLGLYVQLGVAFATSQMAALTLFVAAVSAHLLKRRDEQVKSLNVKLSALERQVADLHGPAPSESPAPRAAAPLPQPAAPAPPSHAPRPSPMKPPAPPRKSEFATAEQHVRVLAEALSTPVSAPDAAPAKPPAQPQFEDHLARSIAALNDAAGSLRSQPNTAVGVAALRGSVPVSATPGPPSRRVPTDTMVAPPAEPPTSRSMADIVADAVSGDRIDVYLQPILGLADRQVRYFEVSARLRDAGGNILTPEVFTPLARSAQLMPKIDGAMLRRTAKLLAWLESRGRLKDVFSGLSADALADPAFVLETGEYALERRDRARHLVLTFSQAALRTFDDAHWDSLSILRELGFKFALDEIRDLETDFDVLRERGFAFAKLAAQIFLEGMPFEDVTVPAGDLVKLFPDMGLALIISEVSDQRSVESLLAHGVELGQGTLFADAKPVKAEVLNSRAA